MNEQHVKECIQACLKCLEACNTCFDRCLQEADVK
ncbi:four-helix bundle copper-binding protein [Domibacillus sp. A3M-37]